MAPLGSALFVASTSPLLQPTLDPETRAAAVLRLAQEGHRSLNTQRAYAGDLRRFFGWCGRPVCPAALLELCALDEAALSLLLSGYAEAMKSRGLAPATINRPLAAIRTLLTIARRKGKLTAVDVKGLVDNEPRRKVRDTRGPSLDEVIAIMQSIEKRRSTYAGKRDWALFRLMWQNALRREEVELLNIENYAPKRKLLVDVKRKGGEIHTLRINNRVISALDDYLEARTGGRRMDNGEPLFANLTTNRPGRLTANGIRTITRRISRRVIGRPVNPHALFRHSAATAHRKITNNLLATKELLGHKWLSTTEIYLDDDGEEMQGEASDVLSNAA